jgi:hypothetical protein
MTVDSSLSYVIVAPLDVVPVLKVPGGSGAVSFGWSTFSDETNKCIRLLWSERGEGAQKK